MTDDALHSRFAGPDQSPGFLLWRVTNAWQRAIRAALAPHGLTHVQFVLLATIASLHPAPVTQRELADAAATDPMMTSQVVRALAARGLIDRHSHPTDRRAVSLRATTEGLRAVNSAIQTVEDADAQYFSALGAQHEGFRDLLLTLDATADATHASDRE